MNYRKIISSLTIGLSVFLLILMISMGLFHIRLYYLNSMAMRPYLKEGSLLLCKKENIEDIDKGDIITYETDNSYITSRVIEVKEKQIFVKMDTQEEIYNVGIEQYNGTLLFSIPYLGIFFKFFKGSSGKLLSFIILFMILLKMGLTILDKKKRRNLI